MQTLRRFKIIARKNGDYDPSMTADCSLSSSAELTTALRAALEASHPLNSVLPITNNVGRIRLSYNLLPFELSVSLPE
jgi:hypothetical protein